MPIDAIKRKIENYILRHKKTKRVRLAVVGTQNSGKSFLLMDVISTLRDLGFRYYDSKELLVKDGYLHKLFLYFSPNEADGDYGGTPLYACRQENHYGQLVKQGSSGAEFILDFLNIPGEIFNDANRVRIFGEIKRRLSSRSGKPFEVLTYRDASGGEKLIVKPIDQYWTATEAARKTKTDNATPEVLRTNFRKWEGIYAMLNSRGYTLVKTKQISGEQFINDFFKFYTDSATQSIADMIKELQLNNLNLNDADDFINNGHDRDFVFFLYCSQATDIVVCDRIYYSGNDNQKSLDFNTLIANLDLFIQNEKRRDTVNSYLAFRNVDFMVSSKQQNFKDLIASLNSLNVSKHEAQAVAYSAFAASLLQDAGLLQEQLEDSGQMINFFFANPPEGLKNSTSARIDELLPCDWEQLMNLYVDLDGDNAQLVDQVDALNHIYNHVNSFKQVVKAGHANPNGTFVPHVYFTSTPINADFLVFRNGKKDEPDEVASEFYYDMDNGHKRSFRRDGSSAHFGCMQLCLDILHQHAISKSGDERNSKFMRMMFHHTED